MPVTDRAIFWSKNQYNLPKPPLGGSESNSAENHTIVIKAMSDLVTDYHANAAIVERFGLAFAEERRLEDTCREHWHEGETDTLNMWLNPEWRIIAHTWFVCENTYLVFAGWVEGIDYSCSGYPPAGNTKGGIKQAHNGEHFHAAQSQFNERYQN